jgi:hypothetical protein
MVLKKLSVEPLFIGIGIIQLDLIQNPIRLSILMKQTAPL